MERELEELGAAVRAHRERGGGHRLPKALKAEVAAAVRRARDAGMSQRRVAALAGVSTQSVQRWTRAPRKTALVPVQVATPTELTGQLTLTSPDGWRVSGLDLRSTAALLRAVR